MQRTADRQKTLAAHGALMSDERLRVVVTDLRDVTALEGRILVHGEEESSGRTYLMLEGTDARVHYLYYTPGDGSGAESWRLTNEFVHPAPKFIQSGLAQRLRSMTWAIQKRSCTTSATFATQRKVLSGAHRPARGWLEWMARALPEGIERRRSRKPTPGEGI